jgi:hypothetical protein
MVNYLVLIGTFVGAFGGALLIRLYAPASYQQPAVSCWFCIWLVVLVFSINRALYRIPKQSTLGVETDAESSEKPRDQLTKAQFIRSHRLVHIGGVVAVLVCPTVMSLVLLMMWPPSAQSKIAADSIQRTQLVLCLLVVCVFSVFSAVAVIIFVAPWLDRKLGVQCRGCGRSVTIALNCQQILKTGKCSKCQCVLFDPRGTEAGRAGSERGLKPR